MDIQEFSDKYLIQADLPGMEKDKLFISATENELKISGERKSVIEKNQQGMRLMERNFGSFERTLPLPENVKVEAVSAKYDQGVLTLTLPKKTPTPENKKEPIKIQIQ